MQTHAGGTPERRGTASPNGVQLVRVSVPGKAPMTCDMYVLFTCAMRLFTVTFLG